MRRRIAIWLAMLSLLAGTALGEVYTGIDQLDGTRIGVQTGTGFDRMVTDRLPNAQVEYYNTKADLVAALTGQKVEAFAMDEPVVQLLMGENDQITYLPEYLDAYLAKLCRRAAIDRLRRSRAGKRWSGEAALALEELEECASGGGDVESQTEAKELAALIGRFLRTQPETARKVFLRRYWYVESVGEIAEAFGWSESKVKSLLFRTRKSLRSYLEKEGYL